MRKLLLLLVAGGPLWAVTPTITNVTSEIRDRAILLRWVTDQDTGTEPARCWYDYDTDTDSLLSDGIVLDRRTHERDANSTNSGRRQCTIYDLTPATKVYVGPQSRDTSTNYSVLPLCTGVCTDCDSGDVAWAAAAGSGLNCDGAGQHPYRTTLAEDTDFDPDPPVSSALTTPPAITAGGGHTYTIESDCSDVAAEKTAAEADANSGDTVELVFPAGVPCGTTGFNLTSITNGGMVVVRSSADPKLLPPAGAQIDKTYMPHVGILIPSAMTEWGHLNQLMTASDNARGYYFWGMYIGPPGLDSPVLTPLDMNITAINTTTNVITVDDITGLTTGVNQSNETVVVNLDGTGVRGGYGIMQLCSVTSTTPPAGTFTLGVNDALRAGGCGTQVDLTGTYGSGGTVRRWITLPITGHGASGGLHTVTITGHGIANYPDMAITGSTASANITVSGVPGEYQIGTDSTGTPTTQVVHIEGTGTGSCDGLWDVSSVSVSTITINRSGFTPNCTGVTTGTVHGHRASSIFRTNNDVIGDHEPQAHNHEVLDANTVQLLEVPAETGVAGGYLFWDVESFSTVFQFGKAGGLADSVEEVTFDRVISLACLPWQELGFFGADSTENVAIINSYVESCMWQRVNPVNGQVERVHGDSQAHQAIATSQSQGLIIDNNYFGPAPFLFNDTDNSGPDTSVDDLSITRNTLWNPDWTNARSGTYRNHFFQRAFTIELKSSGARTAIRGNYFKGWFGNFQASQPAIQFANQGANTSVPSGLNHVAIESNIFDRGSAIFEFQGAEWFSNKFRNFAEKFRFANNLAVIIDTVKYNRGNDLTGFFIQMPVGFTAFTVERNTYLPERCHSCRVYTFHTNRSSGARWLNNILGFTEGSNLNQLGFFQDITSGTNLPAATEDGGNAAFEEFHIRGTGFDPLSELMGNIGIPMIQSSNSGNYSDKAADDDPAVTHCKSSIEVLDKVLNLPMDWVGNANSPCNESLDARLNIAFESGTFRATAAYSGKGADLDTLADHQGLPGPVTVTADDTSVTFAFHAPTTAACMVQIAPWAGNWASSWDEAGDITGGADPSPDQEQVVTFGGLDPETTYAYRGNCKHGFIGQVKTAGAP